MSRPAPRPARTDFQWAAWFFGLLFLLLGIVGFIPRLTTDYGDLTDFTSPGAMALAFIGVNVLLNVVYLVTGVTGLMLSRTWDGARTFLLGGGLIYLIIWLYGLIIDLGSGANFLGLSTGSNWVHFTFGLLMLFIGAVWGRRYAPRSLVT